MLAAIRSACEIDANELIRDTVLLLQPVFKQRSVAVTSQLSEFLPVIYGDANSIQRLLINLLDNAVDACDAGGSVKDRHSRAIGR